MIFHDVEQNKPEWYALRLGIPTSSVFHKIITPKKLTVSTQAPALMYRLLAEWITGEPIEEYEGWAMRRGTGLEDQAVQAYEMLMDVETSRGGFITTDDGLIGCSPDRLIGDTGDLEIKCPLLQTQVERALMSCTDEDHKCQLQGRMLIHKREWVDIFSYHPRLAVPPIRVERDDKFIAILDGVLGVFVAKMLECRERLEARFGPFVREAAKAAVDGDLLGVTDEDVQKILAAQELARQGLEGI